MRSSNMAPLAALQGAVTSLARSEPRRWVGAFWALALVLGVFQIWEPGRGIDPDGISYLDMGDALMRGDWQMAVNGLWSPLYAWLLGLVMWVVRPTAYWEFAVVHLVNFGLYALAMTAFHFLLVELIRTQRALQAREAGMPLPEWAWFALGYTLFIWSSLTLIEVKRESPDMLVAGLTYLAIGLVLRLSRGKGDWRSFAGLGAVLGIGYYAKAFMIVFAVVMIGLSLISLARWRVVLARGLVMVAAFLIVIAPLIMALSLKYGRPTFSEQGRVTYLMHVNHVPFVHWQGGDLGMGVPVNPPTHPSRLIVENPPVYEFGSPVGGSYPAWFDPTYWFEGIQPRFDPASHLRILETSARVYFDIFVLGSGSLLAACIAMLVIGGARSGWASYLAGWRLIVPGVIILGMFALVHVEPRYTGAFVTLLWLGILAGVRLPEARDIGRVVAGITIGVVTVMLVVTAFKPLQFAYASLRDLARGRDPWSGESWRVAEGLREMGVSSGDRVAVIGNGFHASAWARLARARIVAELPADYVSAFWALDSAGQAQVLEAFANTSAEVLVTKDMPFQPVGVEWHRIADTNYYVVRLQK